MCRNVTLKCTRAHRAHNMKKRAPPVPRVVTPKNNSDFAIYSLVITVAVLSYVNSLNGEFVHDDIPAIVTNGDVTGANSLTQLLLDDFWGTPMADVNSHKSYRPLTTLSFRLNYALAGLRPWWWHAFNIVLHAVCCALVTRACVTVARLQRPFAALAAVLFAVHPIHTEAVAGVVGRADVLACIFFLGSLLVYHRPANQRKCVWLSIILGALSMFAKETGITILLSNLAIDIYRCWPLVKKSLYSLKIEKKSTKLTVRTTKVLVSFGLLVCLRLALLQGTWPSFSQQDNPATFHPSFFVRLMTFCYLAAFNWWLLLCPWTLSHDWQMGSVPLVTSGWDPRNLVTCVAFGALLLLCYRCVCDLEVHRHGPAVTGLLLLVIPFIPASNLFISVGFVIAERVLYIPSVGSVIITAYGAQLLWSRPGMKAFLVVSLTVLAATGAVRTYRRNAEWKDRATLLKADLVTLPQNAKLHYNYANFLRETEQPESAIKHYKEALRLWPTYASAHNNLGTLTNLMEVAENHFTEAIKYNKHHVNAHYNLGKIFKKSGRTSQAVSMLERCVWLQPNFVQAMVELLSITSESDKRAIMRRLLQLDPGNWEHYMLFGNWFKEKGLPVSASRYYVEAARFGFKNRDTNRLVTADLISFKSAALMYRASGQRARTLQLITRWHTYRRGFRSAAATHLCLRDWKLKAELQGRVQIYSKAVYPAKSTTCFDHSQLAVEQIREDLEEESTEQSEESGINNDTETPNSAICAISEVNTSNCKTCGTKKRNASISPQIKSTHNKSDTGLKEKKCNTRRKEKTNKNAEVISNLAGSLEHILIKTF